MTAPMTRADVDLIISEARANATTPDLWRANLRGAVLIEADIRGSYLRGADLRSADLSGADLQRADLSGADLSGADLRCADLRHAVLQDAVLRGARLSGADLQDAVLSGADLRCADLSGADLQDAVLSGADLSGADLSGASGASGVAISVCGLPSGASTLYPTPDGWRLAVGCWQGTPDTLRTMIASDDDWPEATGAECARRRPSLQALLALCEDHIARHPDIITYLAAKWTAER